MPPPRRSASRRTPQGLGPRRPKASDPEIRAAGRRRGWGPAVRRRAIRKSEPQDAAGAGAPPSEGERSGNPSRRTPQGLGPRRPKASDPEIRAAGRRRVVGQFGLGAGSSCEPDKARARSAGRGVRGCTLRPADERATKYGDANWPSTPGRAPPQLIIEGYPPGVQSDQNWVTGAMA